MDTTDENGQIDYVNSDEGEEPFVDAENDETMAVTVECPEQDCTGGTNDEVWKYTGEAAVAAVMLEHHLKSHGYFHQQTPAAAAPDTREPRPRPGQSTGPTGQTYRTDGAVQDRRGNTGPAGRGTGPTGQYSKGPAGQGTGPTGRYGTVVR